MTGDSGAKSKHWWENNMTSFERSKLDFITSQPKILQIIKEPTHILENSKSCIDLIFISQPNMGIDSGVRVSLHSHCHHQIIYASPYDRMVWFFKHVNSDHIKRAIDIFD